MIEMHQNNMPLPGQPCRNDALCDLAQDREQQTCEIHKPNDFYGNALALKAFAGLPEDYAIKAAMEHSVELGHGNWNANCAAPLPAIITMSPYRHGIVREHTDKRLCAVGPYIHYASHFLTPSELQSEKQRLGRSLLAFPAHSTHLVTCEHSVDQFCGLLRELGADFDSVRVCIYWKDVLNGTAEEYRRQGFECVCCGHIFDPQFTPRLKSLLATASMTVSNALTSALGYSVLMGVPHYYLPSLVGYSCADESTFHSEVGTGHYRDISPDIIELETTFSVLSREISPRQQEVADRYWGFSSLLGRDELARLLGTLEEMYVENCEKRELR